MPARPRHQQSYRDPPTVPLSARLEARLASEAPTPEAALIARQEPSQALQRAIYQAPRLRLLRLDVLRPGDHIAVELWLSGISQLEIGSYLGVSQQNIARRIKRAVLHLRRCAIRCEA